MSAIDVERLAVLRRELADIERAVEARSITSAQAELGALQRVVLALREADPVLGEERLLLRLDGLLSRLRDSLNRASRPAGKGGRPPIPDNIAQIRCAAIASLEWLIEHKIPPRNAQRFVLERLNRHKPFVRRHGEFMRQRGRTITQADLENWRHHWLPEQSAKSRSRKRNPAVWQYSDLTRTIKEGLSCRSEPHFEAVAVVLSMMCDGRFPDGES